MYASNNGFRSVMRMMFVATAVPMIIYASAALAQEMTTTFVGVDGEPKGSAKISSMNDGTLLTLDLAGMTEGWHGAHLHEKASCDVASKFESAGSHVSIQGERQVHGIMMASGPHAGDLPNVWVGPDGTGKAEFFTPFVLGKDLLDPNGSSLVVHASADDHKTNPSGNSGDRIACGTLVKQ